MTSFADITTMGVGGPIAHFIEPTTRVGLIEAVEDADSKGLPLVVIGGGSNLLVSDKPFDGVVVRDARRLITVPDEAAPVEGEDRTVHVNAEAGANWDDFVAFTVELGLEGVEDCPAFPAQLALPWCRTLAPTGRKSLLRSNRWKSGIETPKPRATSRQPIFDSAIDTPH